MSETDAPALALVGVGKHYAGLSALQDVTFDVPAGDIHGLIGPNGAGKSTLINIVSGFVKPDTGTVSMFGRDITDLRADRLADVGIARTYQNVRLFHGLTVLQTVEAGAFRLRRTGLAAATFGSGRERRAARDRARAILELVGVTAAPRALADGLSYGEQRRVEIARALAADPRILLLDEPAAGMNDREADALGELFRRIRSQGVTVLIIEHNIRLVLELCDHATVLNFGQMLATGTPRQCIDDPDVREAYFGRQSDSARIETLLRVRRGGGGEGGQP
jgi:branched-chain amino acid transport system ATP-binding protein